VYVQAQVSSQVLKASYCSTGNGDNTPTTLAGLSMAYNLSGEGLLDRTWNFANVQGTDYGLEADDLQYSSATQAEDDAIFATFRPDNGTPWQC
jgi:hypothetical protein